MNFAKPSIVIYDSFSDDAVVLFSSFAVVCRIGLLLL